GARRVIGLDIRESVLRVARQRARDAGVADRCVFATQAPEPVDVVVSLDGFEHYADPAGALASMKSLLGRGGRVLVAFGPPRFLAAGPTRELFTAIIRCRLRAA